MIKLQFQLVSQPEFWPVEGARRYHVDGGGGVDLENPGDTLPPAFNPAEFAAMNNLNVADLDADSVRAVNAAIAEMPSNQWLQVWPST